MCAISCGCSDRLSCVSNIQTEHYAQIFQPSQIDRGGRWWEQGGGGGGIDNVKLVDSALSHAIHLMRMNLIWRRSHLGCTSWY